MQFYNPRSLSIVEGLIKLPQFGSSSGGTQRPLNSFALCFGDRCVLFDAPVSNALPGIAKLRREGIRPVACVLSHADIAASGDAFDELARMQIPLLLHPLDQTDPRAARLSLAWGDPMTDASLADLPLEIIHWPGHSPGLVMLYTPQSGGILLTGDATVAPGPMQPDHTPPLVRTPAPTPEQDAQVVARWREFEREPLRTLAPLHGEIYADRHDIAALIAAMTQVGPMTQDVRQFA